MLERLDIKFPINPIIEQVQSLSFDKRLHLNKTDGPLFSGPYYIKEEFKNTPLGNVLASLGNIGEARLLKLSSAESYTAHADPDDRLHLAIITNPYCYLQDLTSQTMYHVPIDGHIWRMDTGQIHVATNFGGRDRIHLNIRVPLPAFKYPGVLISMEGGDYDWKQELHISFMSYLNRAIKSGLVTGIEKVSEKELLLNYTSDEVIDTITAAVTSKGFKIIVRDVSEVISL
jgi:hypothetical protein